MPCQLACVPPDRVPDVWPVVDKLIRAAMEKLQISDVAEVKHDLFNGGALLWLARNGGGVKATAVTQIVGIHGEKYCTIVACGGDERDEWLPLIEGLEVYAKREGCRAMRITGRKGWMRVLPDYQPIAYILERTL